MASPRPRPAGPEPRSPPAAEQRAAAEAFNGHIRALVKDLARRFPLDPELDRLKKRTFAALSLDPLAVIRAAGPHLARHGAQIRAAVRGEGDEFFLQNDFREELKGPGAPGASPATHVIRRVKEAWGALGEPDKAAYRAAVGALLDCHEAFAAPRGGPRAG